MTRLRYTSRYKPNSVMSGTLEPQADPRLDDLDGLLTCMNPGGRNSGRKSNVLLIPMVQSELPRPIKIGLRCVYGIELCTKLQHSVSRKCVRKIVLNHM